MDRVNIEELTLRGEMVNGAQYLYAEEELVDIKRHYFLMIYTGKNDYRFFLNW